MGGGQSVPGVMSYSVALSKMDYAQQAQIKKVHQRLGGAKGASKEAMGKALAGSVEKKELRERIFDAFLPHGNKQRQSTMDLQEFVSGYGQCVYGAFSERTAFLFHVIDTNHDEKITEKEMTAGMKLICDVAQDSYLLLAYPPQSEIAPDAEQYAGAVQDMAASAFRARGGQPKPQFLQFEEFQRWLSEHRQVIAFMAHLCKTLLHPSLEPQGMLESYLVPAPPLMLNGVSEILDDEMSSKLRTFLPSPHCKHNFYQLFSSGKAGFTLMGLQHSHSKRPSIVKDKVSLLLLEDFDGHVFGAYTAVDWIANSYGKFYGTENSFLFRLKPKVEMFNFTGEDSNVILSNAEGIGFGGKRKFHAIYLESDFSACKSMPTMTFGNPQLAGKELFDVKHMELWGFVDKEDTDELLGISEDDDEATKKKKMGVLQKHKQETFILEHLSGRSHGYSQQLGPEDEFDE